MRRAVGAEDVLLLRAASNESMVLSRRSNVNDERPGNSKRSALLNGPLDCVVGRTSQKVQEAHYQVEKTNYQDRRSGPTVPLGLHQHGPRHHK